MLKITSLNFAYKDNRIFENASLTLGDGNLVALLGRNGSGKTTLIRFIMGFLNPKEGKVEIDSVDLSKIPLRERSRLISYIPQKGEYVYPSRVIDYVIMAAAGRIRLFSHPKRDDEEKAMLALKEVGIENLSNRNILELSGGEMQMAMIARSIFQNTNTIIMDEPTSSLDFSNQINVLEKAQRLSRENRLVIYSTHNPEIALMYSSKIVLIENRALTLVDDKNSLLDGKRLSSLYGRNIDIEYLEKSGIGYYVCIPT